MAKRSDSRLDGKFSVKNDLANLDILRSVAVLFVVIAHFMTYTQFRWFPRFNQWFFWMGLTGVCLFFVHTCLVLMWSLERDPHTGRFYIRRWFRLFPLWLVVLTAVVVLHIPIAPPAAPNFGYIAVGFREFLANATMTFNLWYGARIVGASWSLPIEAQMYVLLPLLFFFIRSTRALWVLLVVDALVIASVWSTLDIHTVHPEIFGLFVICIPYFLPGVMAYTLTKKVTPTLPPWTFIVFLLGMSQLENKFGNQFLSSFFCLIIGLGIPFFRQITWRPLVRSAHLVARYSYGIYLCHIPAIFFGLQYLRRHSWEVRYGSIPIVLALMSVALYHGVEAPMIKFGSRLARKVESGPEPKVDETTLSIEPAP